MIELGIAKNVSVENLTGDGLLIQTGLPQPKNKANNKKKRRTKYLQNA